MSSPEEARGVEEDGRGEAQGIDPVEKATVTLQHLTEIFDAPIPLDGGHGEATEEAQQGDSQ